MGLGILHDGFMGDIRTLSSLPVRLDRWNQEILVEQMKCPRPQCDGTMKQGVALDIQDANERVCFIPRPASDGTLKVCLKCDKCGHSVTGDAKVGMLYHSNMDLEIEK